MPKVWHSFEIIGICAWVANRLTCVNDAPRARAKTGDVHEQLRADILGGAYEPGSKLKFAELGARYGASVSVIREALTRLVEQRLVTSEPQLGFRVQSLTLDDLHDLTATRISLELIALVSAMERGGLEWESALVAAHHRLQRTPVFAEHGPTRMSDEWESAHAAFHRALLEGCASPRLLAITDDLRASTELYRRWSLPLAPARDKAREHQRIFDAAIARDVTAASAALREHYEHTATILEKSLARPDQLSCSSRSSR